MSLLREHPRLRSSIITVAAAALLLLTTQVLMPGGGGGGRGTPTAILYSGFVFGLLNALTAAGLVVVYRSTRVINFAQTAIGAAGGELTFQLLSLTGTPFVVALPAGLIVAALGGLIFDLAIGRRFFSSARLVLTVATIAVAGLLSGLSSQAISALPIFPENRTAEQISGEISLRDRLPFADLSYSVGDLNIPYGFAELFAIGLSLLALVGVGAYFRYAKSGIAVRAMAENTERASLLGISTGTLSSIVWSLAGLLSGVGIILTGLVATPAQAQGIAPAVFLPALAAAVLARMKSVPLAASAAIGIGLFSSAFGYSFRDDQALLDLVLFLVIAVGLLVQRRTILRSEESGGVSWEATEEQRTVPRELVGVTGIRLTRYAFIVVGLAVVGLYPFLVSTRAVVLGGVIALFAILALSVLVLTGWAGQVSLGQFAFAAVGGVVAGALTSTVGVPFWFAVPIAAAFTAGFAALVGIPALRIRGLFLAISTFAFAVAVRSVLFDERYFGWLLPTTIERPTLFLLNFEDERSMYFLCLLALLGSIVAVLNLRRTRTARVLIGVRENESNLASFGVSPVRAKLLAFALSGALAGLAGAMLVHLLRGVSPDSFTAQRSIDLFLLSILGGVTSVGGVLIGSAFFNINQFFFSGNSILSSLQPFLVILLLFIEPAGLIGIINRARDSVLRIVAQRRQLVIPSLFADIDPEALEHRLIPLAEPIPGAGLAALPPTERFALASELYAGSGVRFMEQLAPKKRSKEAELIGAAATAVEEEPTP